MRMPETVRLDTAQKEALSSEWCSYDEAARHVQDIFNRVGPAWEWMVPELREALVDKEAFEVVRGHYWARNEGVVSGEDMDLLAFAMCVAAGLIPVSEIADV